SIFQTLKRSSSKIPGNAITLGQFLEDYLSKEEGKAERKEEEALASLRGYRKILKYNVTSLVKIPISELTPKHFWEWADKQKNMSTKRKRNVLSMMRPALHEALRHEQILSWWSDRRPIPTLKGARFSSIHANVSAGPVTSRYVKAC